MVEVEGRETTKALCTPLARIHRQGLALPSFVKTRTRRKWREQAQAGQLTKVHAHPTNQRAMQRFEICRILQ